jgi:hypothetical protein
MNSEFHSIIIIIKIATSSGTKIAEQQEKVIEQEHKNTYYPTIQLKIQKKNYFQLNENIK